VFDIVIPTTAFAVSLVGLAVLAFVDVYTRKVEDYATLVLAFAVIFALRHDGISAEQWAWGAASALLVFGTYLELGTSGRMGGGDVKLSPVPALVFGAVNPLLAIWSVALAFSVQSAFQIVNRHGFKNPSPAMPHVPAIFAASLGSILFGMHLFII
jgi:prepilin signal peptidase PulO-like enzyme (type II secretory pathway)